MTSPEMNESKPLRVLLVEDQQSHLRNFHGLLKTMGGMEVYKTTSLQEAREVLEQVLVDVAFIDLQLSEDIRNRDGLTLIAEIRGRYQTVPVVVSDHQQHSEVRDAMKLGAADYVVKTELEQRVPLILQALLKEREREQELLDLKARGGADPNLGLIGTSVAMQNLRAMIQKIGARSQQKPVPVLVLGPTGSGKEVVAQAIHKLSAHPSEPFLDLNCGAIAETLVESQLFGYVRGAFTGAERDQEGYLSLVGRGTLFLDEVAELSPALQAKLLRVLETRTFRPVGPTSKEYQFRGRIVAATHADLAERVREGSFREDLYQRLNVLLIRVPPLSDHREDIPPLIQHFSEKQDRPLHFTQEAIELLLRRPWPGNVRELRNAIDRLAILADSDRIDVEAIQQHLPLDSARLGEDDLLRRMARKLLELPLRDKIRAIMKALVVEALRQSSGNITEAARKLGKHRKFVERFLKKGDPEHDEDEDENENEPEPEEDGSTRLKGQGNTRPQEDNSTKPR
jgi:DNA-binding NtrC family response regulator